MVRAEPTPDWVVYVVVLSMVFAMMLGKYLIARGDEPIEDVIQEEIDEIEHLFDDKKENNR